MRQIRYGVFETNSSSTHSLTMCTKQEYHDFNSGKLFINKSYRNIFKQYPALLSVDQLREIGIKLSGDENLSKWFVHMSDQELIDWFLCQGDILDTNYFENCELHYFEQEYTTPSGETIIAFGNYGYDG